MRRRSLALFAVIVVVLGVLAGGAVLDATGVIGPGWLRAGPSPGRPASGSAPAADPVLPSLAVAGTPPTTAGVAAVLDPLLRDRGLGPRVSATVVDAFSGEVLLDRAGTRPATPASVAKLATAAAALQQLGPDLRISTSVVAGARAGQVFLVGGGDPTLTASAQPRGAYPRWASLAALTRSTVASLRPAQAGTLRVVVDDSLFSGPAESPAWPAGYIASGVVAPVSALAVDEGRRRPGTGTGPGVGDPAMDAGLRFAAALRGHGLRVPARVTRGRAPVPEPADASDSVPVPRPEMRATLGPPAGATSTTASPRPAPWPVAGTVLGAVRSPPLAVLVEHMLQTSDNDLAEALGRLAARASGRPASFAGTAATVTAALAGQPGESAGTAGGVGAGAHGAGVNTEADGNGGTAEATPRATAAGVRLLDGSGLARTSTATTASLAALLSRAARSAAGPVGAPAAAGKGPSGTVDQTAELWPLITGLPVAGLTGTLADRFTSGAPADAAGTVRAKTGTLSGVSALAGSVVDQQGRLLVFAVLADDAPAPLRARAALDRATAALATCGCR